MKIKLTNWLIVLGLFVTLASCDDHRIPAGQRFRIKKVTPTYANETVSSFAVYNYDDNNRLLTVLNYTASANITPYVFGRRTVYYDEQGRLTKFEDKLEDNGINPLLASYQRTTYAYDTNGNVVAVKVYKVLLSDPSHPILQQDRQLLYGSNQLPDVVKTKLNDGSQFDPILDFVEEYTYSGRNVIKVKRTYNPTHTNNIASTTTETFQYDDKPNPFYGFPGIGSDAFSKNNVIETGSTYTYDANGLLIRKARVDGSLTITYEYETY